MDREQTLLRIANLAGFYRSNPHRFVADFLHINLKVFQKILIFMMNFSNFFMFLAARGLGKTFLTAIFCCVRAVLYPGSKIVIAAGNRSQSIGILEKIRDEILPESPELRAEIDGQVLITSNRAELKFKNSSIIKVVTASDSSRGNRANILVSD